MTTKTLMPLMMVNLKTCELVIYFVQYSQIDSKLRRFIGSEVVLKEVRRRVKVCFLVQCIFCSKDEEIKEN